MNRVLWKSYICLSVALCIHQRLVLCRIVGLHESGVMEKLRLQHFGASKEDVCDPDLQVVSSSLTLADIWPLYSLLALGLVLAGVVFIFEYIFLSREIRKRGGSLQTNGGPVTVLQQNGVEENGVGLWWRTGYGNAFRITGLLYNGVIKWKHFPRYWPFVWGIHRSPVNSPHKGRWRGTFMFSLICAWTNGWTNYRDAGDLRRHRVHYDVIVMVKGIRQSHVVSPDVAEVFFVCFHPAQNCWTNSQYTDFGSLNAHVTSLWHSCITFCSH